MNKYKLQLVQDEEVEYNVNVIKNADDMTKLMIDGIELHKEPEEVLIMIALNIKKNIIGCFEVSRGTVNSSAVHPREVFKRAILSNAAGIVLAHNHPSGSINPSKNDREVTTRMKEAGKILGIELIDHLIIGEDDYFSFVENTGIIN